MFRLRLIALILGIAAIVDGWHEARMGFKYRHPVSMTCQELIDAKDKPSWVSVDDCVVYLGHFQTLTDEKTHQLKGMAVMLFPSVDAAKDKNFKTSLALKIDDPVKRDTVKDNLDKLNALGKPTTEAAAIDAQRRYKMLFETGPLILKEEMMNESLDLIQSRLNPEHVTYAYSSLADKSSAGKGILMLLGGLALSGFIVYTFFRKKD